MKKLILPVFSAILFFLFAGCTLDPFEVQTVDGGGLGGINIAVDVDSSGVINKYSVLSASLSLMNPLGVTQFTNWTVSSTNHHFDFNSSVPGIYYVCLTDYDSLGDTNVFATNINFAAGHNYRLLVTLGADKKQFGIYAETIPQIGGV